MLEAHRVVSAAIVVTFVTAAGAQESPPIAFSPGAAETTGDRRSLFEPALYTPASCVSSPFPGDVAISDPLCPFIQALKLEGISNGCGGASFCPDQPVTRRQMATYLVRAMRGTTSWDAWRDGPLSPSGLDWGAKTSSSSIGTLMEYSQSPGAESGIYFDDESIILWAPGGTGLIRIFDRSQGTDDEIYRFSDGSLSLRPAGLNGTGADSSFTLRFFDNGTEGNETLRWDNPSDRFEMTADLALVMDEGDTVATVSAVGAGYFLDLESTGDVRFMLDSNNDQGSPFTASLAAYRNGVYDIDHVIMRLEESGDMVLRGELSTSGFDLAEAFWATDAVEPGDLVRADPRRAGGVLLASLETAASQIGVVSSGPGLILGGDLIDPGSLEAWGAEAKALYAAERNKLITAAQSRSEEIRRLKSTIDRLVSEATALAAGERARVQREAESRRKELASLIESEALRAFHARHFAPVALAGRVPVKVDASLAAIRVGDPLTAGSAPGWAVRATEPAMVVGTALEPLESGRGKILMLVDRGWWGGEPFGAVAERSDAALSTEASDPRSTDRLAAPPHTLRVEGGGHAELMPAMEAVEAGTLLVIDGSGALRPSDQAEDAAVAGVAAFLPGILAGAGQRDLVDAAVVVAGVALVKVDAGFGPIAPGNLLVASPTRGHAMRADDPRVGTVVGKALGSLDEGTGLIRVLVTLR